MSKSMRNVPVLKRLIPSMKKRLARLTTLDGYSLKRSRGVLLLLNYRNYVDRQISFYGEFEGPQLDMMLAAMERHGCDLFLDVGANIGYYSLIAAKRGAAEKVMSFEPDRRNLAQFHANMLLNKSPEEIEIIAKAVSAESGRVKFLPALETFTGQSRVADDQASIEIEAVALDDVIDQRDRSIFVKMDIEGHELEALAGMDRLISENRIFLQVESFPDKAAALAAHLEARGLRKVAQIEHDHYYSSFD
jgi:FkbM family methyltransferase